MLLSEKFPFASEQKKKFQTIMCIIFWNFNNNNNNNNKNNNSNNNTQKLKVLQIKEINGCSRSKPFYQKLCQ